MSAVVDLAEIIVNPTKESDRSAILMAGRKGTGAVLKTFVTGQRGGTRVEDLGLTNAMREALITALGGTP